MSSELGRNDPCHCGSGKKYKACHLGQDEATAREARSQAGEAAATGEGQEAAPAATAAPKHQRPGAQQPWKRSGQNARGFQKHSAPRKVGGS
jgi:SEC-C motif